MNPIAIDLGAISIYWYSLIILLAMLVGSFLFVRTSKKLNYNQEFITNLLFYGIIFGIIGARLYYVIFNLDYYLKDPLQILAIWNGGLAIHGGIIGGALWFIYYCRKNKKSVLKIFDLAVPSLILAQAIGRWGNFFNMEAHGYATTKETLTSMHLPDFIVNGMYIEGKYYHPTFLYESFFDIIGFVVLIVIRKKYKLRPGVLTGIYFIWYSITRFIIEFFRTDSLMVGSIKVAQAISVILFLFGLFLILHKRKDTRVNRLKERTERNEN